MGIILASSTLLTACGNNDTKENTTNKTEKASSIKKSESSSSTKVGSDGWTYKNDVFKAGILTYKIDNSEVGTDSDGSKVLFIHTTVTNNTNKEQDPSNIYMVLHAKQKTETANKELDVGMDITDDEGNYIHQAEDDALNDSLLPKKTTKAVMMFTLVNDSPVTLEFSNSDFDIIGTKVIEVK